MEHGDVKKFTCDSCSKTFQSKQAKDYHYSTIHSEQHRNERCDTCGKTFSAKVSLIQHIKYVHSDNRQDSCPIRYIEFKQKKDMRVHMLHIHGFNMSKESYGNLEGQERFECRICDSTFKYKKGLNEHMRLVHEATVAHQHQKCTNVTIVLLFSQCKKISIHIKD